MSYITTVRARLLDADPDRARDAHNGIVARLRPRGEPLGATTHMTFARADDPRDFLGIDGWSTLDGQEVARDRKSTRLNSSHSQISYAVLCLKKNTRIR